jgi:O-acetyl-ADP-ribose deacetylase (regulator of RNase III)
MKPAARIALDTILKAAHTLTSVRHVRFVLFDEQALQTHEDVLEDVLSELQRERA